MDILKNKFFLIILTVAILAAVSLWLAYPKIYVTDQKIKEWVANGYTQQFCRVVFSRVANCVTFGAKECDAIAQKQIKSCIDENANTIPSRANQEEAKTIYGTFAKCFESRMHDTIVQKYLWDSPECKEKFAPS